MTIFNVFTLMGGIAMFLYGMDLMGKALEQTAGSKLQGILSTMTSSPIRGLLLVQRRHHRYGGRLRQLRSDGAASGHQRHYGR